MRTQRATVSWMIFAIVAITIGSASAARADQLVVAHVPFAFIVGDSRLPAGDYVVKELDGDPSVIEIASAHGHQSMFTLTMESSAMETPARPQLVFEKFEDQYFLARVIREDGNDRELMLTPALMEREVAATR